MAMRGDAQSKYQIEHRSAQEASIFTTVSEITGIEAEHLLKRKPDVLLPNGLDIDKFPSFEDASIRHSELKFRIKEYLLYHFFPYYSFDLDETLLYFTFARYEFQNKGIDVMIEALSKLNEKMKKVNQANLQGIHKELDLYTEIRGVIDQLMDLLQDMNVLTLEEHQEKNFEQLYRVLENETGG